MTLFLTIVAVVGALLLWIAYQAKGARKINAEFAPVYAENEATSQRNKQVNIEFESRKAAEREAYRNSETFKQHQLETLLTDDEYQLITQYRESR